MEENKNKKAYKSIMLVIVTALVTCIITTFVVYNYALVKTGKAGQSNTIGNVVNTLVTSISGQEKDTTSVDGKISDIKKKLDELYIGDIDEKKMIEGALKGYVSALGDEYTEYLTEEEISDLMQDVKGSYVGIGVYITKNVETNQIVVFGVIEDSPANKAGILVGDIIKKVDDVAYNADQLTQASSHMKGTDGSNVKVTVERDGKEIDYQITRKTIDFKYVKSEKLENNIGYIRITSFEGKCANEFENAYKDLKSQGIKSLIIDLRNNGGGLVDQSLKIAEMVVPKGSTTLITKDKNGKEEVSKSNREPIVDVPIVILVNGYTASASEILTGAIRENVPNTKVVGTQTYGKGIIQGVYLFNDQKTGLKVTIQEYFTPSHSKLHKIGIKPDVEIELPEEFKNYLSVDKQNDNQLSKAIEILK